jgi:hypothetical protein
MTAAVTARVCGYHGPAGTCGANPARPFINGWRCPAHTPAALAGKPEPGTGRYCPPRICWCGHCPATARTKAPPGLIPGREADPSGLTIKAAAHWYLRAGWPVFVLGRSKRPVANCRPCELAGPEHDRQGCECLTCHGFYAATCDPRRVTRMLARVPAGVLAIRTGAASGLCVIDIDPRHGGQPDTGLMTPTATVATGGGGWHLYYRHPGGPTVRALRDRPGVDVKGEGGYVVAPPSIHPATGRRYRWVGDRPVTEMHPPLRAAIAPPPQHPAPPASAVPVASQGGGCISSPRALLAAHLLAVQKAPEGRRRVTLYGAARGAARMVLAGAITGPDARAALTAAGNAHPGLTPAQIRNAINGAFHDEGAAA